MKAAFLYKEARNRGFTDWQAKALAAQIDHESAGTWSETVKGDGGCSIGLSQWNECAKKEKAPVGWKDQIHSFLDITKDRYEKTKNFEMTQVAWNKPKVMTTGAYKTKYFYRLQNSLSILN